MAMKVYELNNPIHGDNGLHAAGADLSAAGKDYTWVNLDVNGDVVACDNAGDKPFGILQNRPKAGQRAIVRMLGFSQLRVGAGGALAIDDQVGTDASGLGVAKTANAAYAPARCLVAGAISGMATVSVNTLTLNTISA